MREYATRILTGLILGAVVLSCIILHSWALAIIISLACVVSIWELAIALKKVKMLLPVIPACISGVIMPFAACYGGISLLMIVFIIFCAGIFLYTSFEPTVKDRHTGFMTGILAITYIPLMLSFYVLLRDQPDGIWKVLLIVIGTVSSDTGGFVFGKRFGTHQMSPIISPKKTYEGLAGSFIFCFILQFLYIYFAFPKVFHYGWLYIPILSALLITFLGTFGDLAESVIKREVDIKDIGGILPGHGGVLDRLDSLIITAPIMYFMLGFFI